MITKTLQKALSIRGDSLYCPLAFSLDTYSNCEADCYHCYLRRLNQVWDQDLRPIDVEKFKKDLLNGLLNKNPKSPLAWALAQKKTLKFGNKADPFQPIERKLRVSYQALVELKRLKWPVVIETKYTRILMDYFDILIEMKTHLHVLSIISCGLEEDWKVFERQRTTSPETRMDDLHQLSQNGIQVGANGEPFIPGYHTVEQFENTIKLLKSFDIPSYNVYNLHFNAFVAKRLANIGIDVERIWYYNQDNNWRPILKRLIEIAEKNGIVLGCPDFVNSEGYLERSNTCCGVEVSNPCTFNIITLKRKLLQGQSFEQAVEECWDGVGDYEYGLKAFQGKDLNSYSLRDIGIFNKIREGLFF